MIVSIFYNRLSCHHLITKVIKPFIRQEQDRLKSYSLTFGTNQGDHLIFGADHQDNDDLQKRFSLILEQFLSANPSETKLLEYPLRNFFMDYPNNSFHFNKESFPSYYDDTNNIRQQISNALMDALGNYEIDAESIYTFIIYMQLGIIRAANDTISKAYDSVVNLVNYTDNEEKLSNGRIGFISHDNNSEDFKLIFDSNKEMLIEIIDEIWATESYNTELKWLENWMADCRKFIKKHGFEQAFNLLNALIHNQGGLNNTKLTQLSSKLILNSFNHFKISKYNGEE